jgi:hypothetical protein
MVADWPSESTSELVTAGKGREGSASASEQAPSTPAIEASEQEFTIGVSKTAQWVGYFRVLEAERDNPLFVDFLAKTLVGGDQARHVWNRMIDSVGMPRFIMSRERYSRMEHNHFVVRHRYMDDFALRYLGELEGGHPVPRHAGAGRKTSCLLSTPRLLHPKHTHDIKSPV